MSAKSDAWLELGGKDVALHDVALHDVPLHDDAPPDAACMSRSSTAHGASPKSA